MVQFFFFFSVVTVDGLTCTKKFRGPRWVFVFWTSLVPWTGWCCFFQPGDASMTPFSETRRSSASKRNWTTEVCKKSIAGFLLWKRTHLLRAPLIFFHCKPERKHRRERVKKKTLCSFAFSCSLRCTVNTRALVWGVKVVWFSCVTFRNYSVLLKPFL